MDRVTRFALAFPVAAIGVLVGVREISAQTPVSPAPGRQLVLPVTGTSGLSGAFWRKAIANGGPMPQYERLLVIDPSGLVLGEADGNGSQVLLPMKLFTELSAGTRHATLVHNHPAGVSLSGDDLAQLGKPGVDRVIAVGHDGSVFEATAGTRFNSETFDATYRRLLTRVMETMTDAGRRDGVDVASLTPLVCHVVATILDRAQVIQYRTTPSLELQVALDRYHRIVQGTVSGESTDNRKSGNR